MHWVIHPEVVGGYCLNKGTGWRKAVALYNFYPDKKQAQAMKPGLKKDKQYRLFNRWLKDQSENPLNVVPYRE
jgi:hypothetical protein